jgi:acetyl-CoA carboxylase biotin carboxyl carrier protein
VAKARERAGDESPSAGRAGGKDRADQGSMTDLDFVRGLIEVVDASGIDSLEITRAGTRVKISKTPPAATGSYYLAPPAQAAPHPAASNAGPGAAVAPAAGGDPGQAPVAPATGGGQAGGGGAEAAAGASADAAGSGLLEVKSPMVGTFYRAPAPEAPPYVEVGTRVTKGQTLCILEAMKLMNELESEFEGVVRQVLVENAEPVEYGQVLFRIDPTG